MNVSQLRVGLIGCGAFGESRLATFAGIPFARVVAVTDMNAERARGVAERHNVATVCSDYQELIARPDIDAVSVVTTEDQHLVPVLAALERGKHVFVEKPMTEDFSEYELKYI
jgi:predicted dehydrogenase